MFELGEQFLNPHELLELQLRIVERIRGIKAYLLNMKVPDRLIYCLNSAMPCLISSGVTLS